MDLTSYQDNGYLILNDFLTEKECSALIHRAQELVSEFEPTDEVKTVFSTTDQAHTQQKYFLDSADKIRFFFEKGAFDEHGNLRFPKEKSLNKIGHALHYKDPIFAEISNSSKIIDLAKKLKISDPLLLQSMYIFKQPFIGDEVIPHQDNTYVHVKDHPITGFWFALQDATIENGCLWVIPGGHKTPLKSRMKRHGDEISFDIFDDSPWELEKMIPLEVPRGSVIVLHGLLPHMSKENLSPKSRHAYTLHLMSSEHDYAEDNWLKKPTV